MLSVAYLNAVNNRLAAWRIIDCAEQSEKSKGNHDNAAWAREFCTKVEGELQRICSAILELLDQSLIPKTSDGESKVFYQKMKADYYRHIAEFTTDDAKTKAANSAEAASAEAAAVAEARRHFFNNFCRVPRPPILCKFDGVDQTKFAMPKPKSCPRKLGAEGAGSLV